MAEIGPLEPLTSVRDSKTEQAVEKAPFSVEIVWLSMDRADGIRESPPEKSFRCIPEFWNSLVMIYFHVIKRQA